MLILGDLGLLGSLVSVLVFVLLPFWVVRDIARSIKKHIPQAKPGTAGQRLEEEQYRRDAEWARKEKEWNLWEKQWKENKRREQELRDAIEAASDYEEECALRRQLTALLHEMSR